MQTNLGIKYMHNIENVLLLTMSWYYLYHVMEAQNYIKCRKDSRVSGVHVLVLNPMHKTFNLFYKSARLHLLFIFFGGGVVPIDPRPSRVSTTEVTFPW